MKRALSPIRRRMRAQRALTGLCWGLLAALALAAAVMALSHLTPLGHRPRYLALCALPLPLGALAGALWPLSLETAARRADACGLKERAQTALALWERTDDMARLQREDALTALQGLDAKAALPLRAAKRPLLAAALCGVAAGALLFLPNAQDDVLRRQEQFAQRMEKPAQAVEQAADQLEHPALADQTAQELRRLLGDLSRQLRDSRDSREALTALGQTRQQMEKLLSEGRNAAQDALGAAGLESLAQALAEGDGEGLEQALEEALEAAAGDMNALAQQMSAAAQAASANAAASTALQAAAQALSQGNAAQAAQALGQLSAAGLSAGQVSAALQSAHALAGGQGQGQGQGGGAGRGTTNQDMGGAPSSPAGSSGSGSEDPTYRLGEYESIYDPTRLGDGGKITQSTGQVDENAQISEVTLGPGLGDASGSVPYDQVIGEYQAAAVQKAQEAALPGYAQQWVADYFGALTE